MSPGYLCNLLTIKKFIIGLLIGLSLIASSLAIKPKQVIAEDNIPKELIVLTKGELIDKVYKYSKLYKADPTKLINTINCENKDWDTKLQSRIINSKGEREDSWGLAQIHKPSHPELTHEQITDPDFAISFMAENISKGRGNMWTCYRKLNN